MSHDIKPGDRLLVPRGMRHSEELLTVDRITKSGRLICGRIQINPDLSVRGKGLWGYRGARIPTAEDLRRHHRNEALLLIQHFAVAGHADEHVFQIAAAIEAIIKRQTL